jgi:hypothetical protein
METVILLALGVGAVIWWRAARRRSENDRAAAFRAEHRDASLRDLGACAGAFPTEDLEPFIRELGLERAGRKAFASAADYWTNLLKSTEPLDYEAGAMNLDAALVIAIRDSPYGRPGWWTECLSQLGPTLWNVAEALASGATSEDPESATGWAKKFLGLCAWAGKEGLPIPPIVKGKMKLVPKIVEATARTST